MPYVWDFAILGKYSHLFWLGLGWTIAYTIGTVVLGTVLGLVVGIFMFPRRPSLYLFAAVSASFCVYACSVLLSHPEAFKIVGSYLACALISCI